MYILVIITNSYIIKNIFFIKFSDSMKIEYTVFLTIYLLFLFIKKIIK